MIDINLKLLSYIRKTVKANLKNLSVKEVNPAKTSQICSKCGVEGFRLSQNLFICPDGHRLNADSNASINIAKKHC